MAGDQRGDPRLSVNHKCWIVAAADRPGVAAQIANISKTGARLVAPSPETVPDEFILAMTADGRICRRCRVVWRQGSDIGITFLPGHQQPIAADADSSWSRKLGAPVS